MMPDYTLEQKAQAFDNLWENCGNTKAEFLEYVVEDIPYSYMSEREALYKRKPKYQFIFKYVGTAYNFKDVLHKLATEKKGNNRKS